MVEHRIKILVVLVAAIVITTAFFSRIGTEPAPQVVSGGAYLDAPFDSKYVEVDGAHALDATDPDEEFVSLFAEPGDRTFLHITGLEIENAEKKRVAIGHGVETFKQGKLNKEKPIAINKETELIVSSGESPIGVSFRENRCSGFLEQFQDFNPPLETDCPSPNQILSRHGINRTVACRVYLDSLPWCETKTDNFPSTVSELCQSHVKNYVHHNSCVDAYSKDLLFSDNTWRIYLNQEEELWSGLQETVTVFDQLGEFLDSKTFFSI